MIEIPQDAITAAVDAMWHDADSDEEMARAVLEATAPILAKAVAQKIRAHMADPVETVTLPASAPQRDGNTPDVLRNIASLEIGANAPWLADELTDLADRLEQEMNGINTQEECGASERPARRREWRMVNPSCEPPREPPTR